MSSTDAPYPDQSMNQQGGTSISASGGQGGSSLVDGAILGPASPASGTDGAALVWWGASTGASPGVGAVVAAGCPSFPRGLRSQPAREAATSTTARKSGSTMGPAYRWPAARVNSPSSCRPVTRDQTAVECMRGYRSDPLGTRTCARGSPRRRRRVAPQRLARPAGRDRHLTAGSQRASLARLRRLARVVRRCRRASVSRGP